MKIEKSVYFLLAITSLFTLSYSTPNERKLITIPINAQNDEQKVQNSQRPLTEIPSIDLKFYENQFTCSIDFGTPLATSESSYFVINTLIPNLIVSSKDCQNCARKYYDPDLSSTSDVNPDIVTLDIGGFSETGVWVTDQVCVVSDACNDDSESLNVEFFAVKSTSNLESQFDGIFGLVPLDYNEGPTYIQ